MARRSGQEVRDWKIFPYDGRNFVRATVPKGDNLGREYQIAERLAERYEVKGFFASGGCGLILRGRDLNTETDILIKTTLDYQLAHYAQGRDIEGMCKSISKGRLQLQTERRIMVLLKNSGCNGMPNPNDYVFDWNPALAGPHKATNGGTWTFNDQAILANEPYLIMEQIDGRQVDELIGTGMPEQQALRIILQVAHVLSVAHKVDRVRGRKWEIVYQDLKPANIMVGAHDYVSLLDWGGCRLFLDGGHDPVVAGASTPGYCAPESDMPSCRLSQAYDSFTIGSTLYHMLTGVAPASFFSSAHAAGAKKALRRSEWNEEKLKKAVSEKTASFVLECLRDDPKDRPQNGAELRSSIASLLR